MIKRIVVKSKEVAGSGFGANGRAWTKFKYETADGETYFMFDNLEVDGVYDIESYTSKGKDGKEYTNWGLPKKGGRKEEKLDEVLKLVKWLVKNNPNYQPPQEKPEGNPPY